MTTTTTETKPDQSTLGTILCTLSAVAYVVFYSFMRLLADTVDSAWINCVQATVAAAVIGLYLAWQGMQGKKVFPKTKDVIALVVLGVMAQVAAVALVWSMPIVGVGVGSVIQTGIMLALGVILGFFLLGEKVTMQQIIATVLIVIAVGFFSMGPSTDSAGNQRATGLKLLLGIAGAAAAGVGFGTLMVGIRKLVTGDVSTSFTVFVLNLAGLALLPWCLYRLGSHALIHTPRHDLLLMISSGPINLIALMLVTKSLSMITVVRANIINNGGTTALLAITGMLIFSEAFNRYILIGIILSLVGILMISLVNPAAAEAAPPTAGPAGFEVIPKDAT